MRDPNKWFMLFFGIMIGVSFGTLARMFQPYVTESMKGSSDATLILIGAALGFLAAIYVVRFG